MKVLRYKYSNILKNKFDNEDLFIFCFKIYNLNHLNLLNLNNLNYKLVPLRSLKQLFLNFENFSGGYYILVFIKKENLSIDILNLLINNNYINYLWIFNKNFLYYLSLNSLKLNLSLNKTSFLMTNLNTKLISNISYSYVNLLFILNFMLKKVN